MWPDRDIREKRNSEVSVNPVPEVVSFHSRWQFGQRVIMDDDLSIRGTITGFCFRVTRDPTVEVSWFHNCDTKIGWFEEWRLAKADGP